MATIQYGDVLDARLLPIDAQDVVTKVRLVIAGNRAGLEPINLSTKVPREGTSFSDTIDYRPRPIVFEYEATEHETYGATRTFALPEGTNPFLPPTDELMPEPTLVQGFTNPGSPSAIRDGDPTTYAEASGSVSSWHLLSYSLEGEAARLCAGAKLKYALLLTTAGEPYWNRSLRVAQRYGAVTGSGDFVNADGRYALAGTDDTDDPVDSYVVLPWDSRSAVENHGDLTPPDVYRSLVRLGVSQGLFSEWRVTDFYPLILNEALLEEIAKSNVRLPAEKPQRVTVRGYVAPDREHTIVGWPGGDYTATVAQHQYELGRTVIDFEQAGSPVGLDADAIEAARFQDARVASAIASAGYSLKMGERQ